MPSNKQNISDLLKASNDYFKDLQRKKVQKDLQKLDDELFQNKPKNLIVKDICERTFWQENFDITIKRRRYIDKNTGNYHYLLDEHLNIEPSKYVLKNDRVKAQLHFTKARSYSEIATLVFNDDVTKQSIHNFIKNTEVEPILLKHFHCSDGILNINVDGIFVKKNPQSQNTVLPCSKKQAAFHIKSFVFFTNASSESKPGLNSRTMKFYVEEVNIIKNNKQISDAEEVMSDKLMEIVKLYDNVKEIRLIGDNATWIKNLAPWLGATYCSDKFHIRKQLKDMLGPKRMNKYSYALKILSSPMDKNKLKDKLTKLVANEITGEVTKDNLRIIGFLVNNHKSYLRTLEFSAISAIEAIQAHYIARFFKRQRKGWSFTCLKHLIVVIENTFNSPKDD